MDDDSTSPSVSLSTLAVLGVPITGEVTDVDREYGTLTIATAKGEIEFDVPLGTAEELNVGDRVSIEFPLSPSRS